MNLEFKYTYTGVQWKSFHCASSFSLSMVLRDLLQVYSNKHVSLKGVKLWLISP
jgi:hypothetical protein